MRRFLTVAVAAALILGVASCDNGAEPSRYDLTVVADPPAGGTAQDLTGASPYTAGTSVSIRAIAEEGYVFVGWTAPAGALDDDDVNETTFTMPAQHVTVTANFEAIPPGQFGLTVSSTEGGSVTVPGEGTFAYQDGTIVDLVAVADECYEFAGWTGDAVDDPDSSTTSITMDGARSVTANFILVSYSLTVGSTEGGSVTTPGEGVFSNGCGTVVDLVATPEAGYRFMNWTGDTGAVADVESYTTTITMNDDCSISAGFIKTYDLTTGSSSGGSVTNPGEGTFTYDTGTVVDLVATPEVGYRFVNWTGDVGTVGDVDSGTTTISMTGDYSITANFVATYALTISSTAGGSVTTPGEGVFTYDAGTVVDLVATPEAGYRFVNWTGDVNAVADVDAAGTTVMVEGSYEIVARFEFEGGSMVAASWGHTVGLASDGTVVAAGRNNEGQCDVGGWTDIVQVSAGYYHTVGLRANGTVVAVGSNENGECSVSGWTDIVQVVAGGYHTVGLTSDGTVVAVGRNSSGQCDVGDWIDIIQITAGHANTVGLASGGTVVAAGRNIEGQCNVEGWTDIVQVAAGHYHTVGLKYDGTVLAVGLNDDGQCNVEGWTNIVQVAGGWYHSVGLEPNGKVTAVGGNNQGQCNVAGWTDIVQVATGSAHTVGLRSDGTVTAVGANSYGQCGVGDWNLIV